MDWNAVLVEIKGERTQRALAAELDYNEAYIARLLNGERPISNEVKRRIAQRYPEYLSPFLMELLVEKEGV